MRGASAERGSGIPGSTTEPTGRSLPLPATALADPGTERPVILTAPRRGKPPRHWFGLTPDERIAALTEVGVPRFRASQISTHVFSRLEPDPSTWTDLSAAIRERVRETFFPQLLTPIQELTADKGKTLKTAWRLHDGSLIESVLMRYPRRATLCISTEAGCGMACPFCATGQGGLQRNLSASEIVAQVMTAATDLAAGKVAGGPGHLNNVVLMGMGEPLANYSAVLAAVRTLVRPQPDGLGLSARGITVSTVGLAPKMRQLATEGLPVTLAVSLHAPDDELRDELIPVNQHWKVDEVVDAAWHYANTTRRRVSIEYALIRGINDQAARADRLAKVLKARGDWTWAHVNLIPLNPTPGSKWTASSVADQQEFVRRLEQHKVPVTIRDTRGRDIDGACGQLIASLDTLAAE